MKKVDLFVSRNMYSVLLIINNLLEKGIIFPATTIILIGCNLLINLDL